MHVYVSGIRKALGAGDGEAALRASSSGYVLDVHPELVDARRAERLLEEAKHLLAGDPARARELFAVAVALWRGPPLAELEASELARREANRLEELRALAVEGL